MKKKQEENNDFDGYEINVIVNLFDILFQLLKMRQLCLDLKLIKLKTVFMVFAEFIGSFFYDINFCSNLELQQTKTLIFNFF